jgi:hypothetical protein
LFSQLTGQFSFQGPLNLNAGDHSALLAKWQGEGQLESGSLQIQKFILNLKEKVNLKTI